MTVFLFLYLTHVLGESLFSLCKLSTVILNNVKTYLYVIKMRKGDAALSENNNSCDFQTSAVYGIIRSVADLSS